MKGGKESLLQKMKGISCQHSTPRFHCYGKPYIYHFTIIKQTRESKLIAKYEKQIEEHTSQCTMKSNDLSSANVEVGRLQTKLLFESLVAQCEDYKLMYNEVMVKRKQLHNIVRGTKGNCNRGVHTLFTC
ncbi:kinesin-like protein KIN-14E isoform X2 [Miscanthus floridulus]|uniref:kinesin-like protein KIN-14E isoform X2 n=1 Tax=Miscanthus floridulus TaxID=154761 RepID=UPI00345B1FCB